MSEKGETILKAIRSLRQFHSDVALLLKTADEPMRKLGWKPCSEGTNTATSDNSASIQSPAWWVPHYAFRYYESDEHPAVACFISVIMDDLDDDSAIQEPLVSAGLLKYAKKVTNWEWWYAKVASRASGVTRDGAVCEFSAGSLPKAEETFGIIGGKVLALPLVEVEDATTLEQKVIEPLVRAIRQGVHG